MKNLFEFMDEPPEGVVAAPPENPVAGHEFICVPNHPPETSFENLRIAIIGEAPGAEEVVEGKPFVGQSGRYLNQILSIHNILRSTCFVGNVMQVRPPLKGKKQLSPLDKWTKSDEGDLEYYREPRLKEDLEQLTKDLDSFNPDICILLGRTALWAAKDGASLDDWRGSQFVSTKPGPFLNRRCLATFHPARCLREYGGTPLVIADIGKAKRLAKAPGFGIPERNIGINLPHSVLLGKLTNILFKKPVVGCDIEGYLDAVSCIGFATSPTEGFVVPFEYLDRRSVWTVEEEADLWGLISLVLADETITKVWQNGLYDRFVLQNSLKMIIRGNQDIMLKHWEIYCEMEKALAVQASIYTDEPFYKFERKTEDQDTFYRYCGKDACVTLEIWLKQARLLPQEGITHYNFNNDALNIFLYMSTRGIRYNAKLAAERREVLAQHINTTQAKLDEIAVEMGVIKPMNFAQSNIQLLADVNSICCYKKDQTRPKKDYLEAGYYKVRDRLLDPKELTLAEKCDISVLCDTTMNMKSYKKFAKFLYQDCGLPTQWKKDPVTKEFRVTTDYEALLKLSKNHTHPALELSLELTLLLGRHQLLGMQSREGRMHCSYNLVGSETARVTTSKSSYRVRGIQVGGNMQAIPDDWEVFPVGHPVRQGARDLLIADPGCYIGKLDLKGADGWTVGSYMAMLGDPTMLDDLKFGIKPAQVTAYILRYGSTEVQNHFHDRPYLKELVSCIKKEDWEYFVSKQGFWGTCYTMGPRKIAERVFIESEGKVSLSESQAKEFQAAIYVRYRVKLWQQWMERHLVSQEYPAKLIASNGFTRRFFGRNFKQRCEILGEALAHLPQVYTTYAILLAATNLWNDPDNRLAANRLRVEPLHSVHDELVVQWKIPDTEWALVKLKSYFNNIIQIANQRLIIPYDGAYGTGWSMDKHQKVGEIK